MTRAIESTMENGLIAQTVSSIPPTGNTARSSMIADPHRIPINHQPLYEFIYFSRLLPELRVMIWKAARPGPRLITAHHLDWPFTCFKKSHQELSCSQRHLYEAFRNSWVNDHFQCLALPRVNSEAREALNAYWPHYLPSSDQNQELRFGEDDVLELRGLDLILSEAINDRRRFPQHWIDELLHNKSRGIGEIKTLAFVREGIDESPVLPDPFVILLHLQKRSADFFDRFLTKFKSLRKVVFIIDENRQGEENGGGFLASCNTGDFHLGGMDLMMPTQISYLEVLSRETKGGLLWNWKFARELKRWSVYQKALRYKQRLETLLQKPKMEGRISREPFEVEIWALWELRPKGQGSADPYEHLRQCCAGG